ncbi:hypothetical protein Pmani_028390 [Petrolisthes manimaculis]|uniref:Uncharacterized protein n=1 Tax=Petrolisthes manimaculis TaxID=1843537 RepID=A0AAE1TVR4_9EUCA|nr:hypothetical protein Pmani_028390 [Petrolisthes manimaculis]
MVNNFLCDNYKPRVEMTRNRVNYLPPEWNDDRQMPTFMINDRLGQSEWHLFCVQPGGSCAILRVYSGQYKQTRRELGELGDQYHRQYSCLLHLETA